MSGTTRETASRVLKRLETQGYICCKGRTIAILREETEDVPILVETTQAPFIIFDTENIPIFPYLKQRKEPDMKKLAPHDSSVKPLDAVPAEEIDALDTRIA